MSTERKIVCPTERLLPDGTPHSIFGCGSANVLGPDDEGVYDCLDCGIWFIPEDGHEAPAEVPA